MHSARFPRPFQPPGASSRRARELQRRPGDGLGHKRQGLTQVPQPHPVPTPPAPHAPGVTRHSLPQRPRQSPAPTPPRPTKLRQLPSLSRYIHVGFLSGLHPFHNTPSPGSLLQLAFYTILLPPRGGIDPESDGSPPSALALPRGARSLHPQPWLAESTSGDTGRPAGSSAPPVPRTTAVP